MPQAPIIPEVTEGESINLVEFFLDEMEDPIIPTETQTGPEVLLLDNDNERSIISNAIGTPGQEPGSWQVDFSVPKIGLEDKTNFEVTWRLVDEEFQTHTLRTYIQVYPCVDNRNSDIVFVKPANTISYIDAIIPVSFSPSTGDQLFISAYLNNEPVFEMLDVGDPTNGIKFNTTSTRTSIQFRDAFQVRHLQPHNLQFQYKKRGQMIPQFFTHNLWVITPQVTTAANLLEQYINKAKLENVIPALEYTYGDLVMYLSRGLNLLNTFPPIITNFTGMNMQGHVLDAWLTCSAYYALGAQLQAEGALAFDFSGQSVNLNIDRTPTIEGALGRIEQHMDQHIRPYKKMLAKAGMVQGDGSIGSQHISYGDSFGIVMVTNSPTTKHGYGGGPGRSLNGWTSSPNGGGRGRR